MDSPLGIYIYILLHTRKLREDIKTAAAATPLLSLSSTPPPYFHMVITANLFINQRASTTALKQPKEIGYYSRTSKGEYLAGNDVNLKYYYLPDSDVDRSLELTAGLRKFRDYEAEFPAGSTGTLKGLLETIQLYEERRGGKRVHADIVASVKTLVKLILTAYYTARAVEFRIVAFDGQLFIREYCSPSGITTATATTATTATNTVGGNTGASTSKSQKGAAISEEQTRSQRQRLFPDVNKYTVYKFKALATLSKPVQLVSRETLDKRPKKSCNNGDKYVSVVKTGVGNVKLVLDSTVDCIFDFKEDGKDNLTHYAYLFLSPWITSTADTRKFEQQIFKVWLECFLSGVPKVIVGYRNDAHTLRAVEEFQTSEIPILLKSNSGEFGPRCLDAIKWYGLFTEWLLKIIPRDDPKVVRPFKLRFQDNHLKLSEVVGTDPEYFGLVNGEDILTDAFKTWRLSLT